MFFVLGNLYPALVVEEAAPREHHRGVVLSEDDGVAVELNVVRVKWLTLSDDRTRFNGNKGPSYLPIAMNDAGMKLHERP